MSNLSLPTTSATEIKPVSLDALAKILLVICLLLLEAHAISFNRKLIMVEIKCKLVNVFHDVNSILYVVTSIHCKGGFLLKVFHSVSLTLSRKGKLSHKKQPQKQDGR